MNSPSGSVLLDKNIIRRVYEYRARVFDGKRPTRQQAVAANAYSRILGNSYQPCLTTETHNVLQLRPPLYAAPFLAQTYALKKGRYLRRWARRLRSFMFTREDTIILAYGSFGMLGRAAWNISSQKIWDW